MFGNEDSSSNEDSYVERLLDCIKDGKLPEDRRNAMAELQAVVAESHSAQLAFGTMGFPVLFGVLKELDDVEMVRGAVDTLLSALTPISLAKLYKNEVQPAMMNADLLSRDEQNISLLLNLLSEDDFYVRYYTLQLLTALLTNSHVRLQEAILTIPRGITRLVDMLMDREVWTCQLLLLLTYLTREAEEIQKILVFEGAFEKIFSIIKEEGGSDGGVVVQVLLRETIGFDSLISILKLRGSTYSFSQQKTINLLCVLETIRLLMNGGSEADLAKQSEQSTNKTVLAQRKVLDHLLMLGVESQWASVAVRCAAFRCIGDLIYGHRQNLDALASKFLGDEPQVEPALNSILRIILRTSSTQEFVAADYVFKSFCEENTDGQKVLASTLIPQPLSLTHAPFEEDVNMSFGSMLIHGLALSEHDGDLETSCRAASVLSYILKENIQCKEKVLKIEFESPTPSLGTPEPLLHRMVKYLALAFSKKGKDVKSTNSYVQPIILKLLVTWLSDCPNAVHSFLASRPHLTYLIELISNNDTTVCVRGLAAVLLGECVIFNKSIESGKDAFSIVDAISQKIGLTSYFQTLEEMQKSFVFSSAKPATKMNDNSVSDVEDIEDDVASGPKNEDHPMLAEMFDSQFVNFIKNLETSIRDGVVNLYSHPKSDVSVIPAELDQRKDEADVDYIKRLKLFLEKQCSEIQDLLNRNAILAEDLAKTGGGNSSQTEPRPNGGSERVQIEKLKRDLLEASQRVDMLKNDNSKLESEVSSYKTLSAKIENDLKSLSDAYNSLEQANYHLENEVRKRVKKLRKRVKRNSVICLFVWVKNRVKSRS
ncbi:putative vesicle tethering protein Uso1/P115-like, head [Helianthus annuus]|nr:putative vesicle tethering protein Uso1/P115-like, head [Helianthus annuus]